MTALTATTTPARSFSELSQESDVETSQCMNPLGSPGQPEPGITEVQHQASDIATLSSSSTERPDVLIAVMGRTGSGKSTFINLASGSKLPVSRGLKSCTSDVIPVPPFILDGRRVILVDTPGFDDTTLLDTDILRMISAYLVSTYEKKTKLSGVIYMHKISDNRMGGISLQNFGMFRKLCGDETLKNVFIVTTMWGQVTLEEGNAREAELKTDEELFKPAIDREARMLRHDNTIESARKILEGLINNTPQTLRIQKELVDEGREITQTSAGVEIERRFLELIEEYKRDLAKTQELIDEAITEKDLMTKQELETHRLATEEKIRRIQFDRESLSRKYAETKARADRQLEEFMAALDVEKARRTAMEREIEELKKQLADTSAVFPEKRAKYAKRIADLSLQVTGVGVGLALVGLGLVISSI